MNQQDIIAMAREANMNYWVTDDLEKFAKLVIKNEREECAKIIENYPHWLGENAKKEISTAVRQRGKK